MGSLKGSAMVQPAFVAKPIWNTINDRCFILMLIYAIVLFKWLSNFKPLVGLYDFMNPAASISSSHVLIEDQLVVFLGFVLFSKLSIKPVLWKQLGPILKPLLVFLAIGFFFLGYSVLLKGGGDVLADFRIFALGVLGIGSAIAFRDEEDLYRFFVFIAAIWFVDVGYQYYLRFEAGGWLFFGKGAVYINRWQDDLGFMASLAILHSRRPPEIVKIWVGMALVLYLITLMLDETRATMLFVFVATIVFMLLEGVGFKHLLKISAVIALVAFPLIVYKSARMFGDIRSLQDIYHMSGTVYVRSVAWDILFHRILEAPLLGHGLGNHGDAINLLIVQHPGERPIFIGSAHNAHLIFMYHIGLLGVLSYMALVVILVRQAVKSVVANATFLANSVHAAVAGIFAYLLHIATTPLGIGLQYYFWFYLLILTAAIGIVRRDAATRGF